MRAWRGVPEKQRTKNRGIRVMTGVNFNGCGLTIVMAGLREEQ
ncbi:Nuclear pore complex protein Nup85 [Psidium guajava]|nr:Nuclear pore complex protein Nup85 [Psidium guajava]